MVKDWDCPSREAVLFSFSGECRSIPFHFMRHPRIKNKRRRTGHWHPDLDRIIFSFLLFVFMPVQTGASAFILWEDVHGQVSPYLCSLIKCWPWTNLPKEWMNKFLRSALYFLYLLLGPPFGSLCLCVCEGGTK